VKKIILILLLSTISAFANDVPESLLKAREDFSIQISTSGTIDVKRGQQFVGKVYANMAKIRINGVWYQVSRNQVTTVGVDPSVTPVP